MGVRLPTARPEPNWDLHRALWAEIKFRQKVLWRLYPEASFRYTQGGFFWDRNQPSYVLVILNKTSRGVHVDEEMSLLMQAIDANQACTLPEPDPQHPVAKQNSAFDTLVACACLDEMWERDDVQDFYARMMGKEPLDRLVEAVGE
jgi:hypothetical protein